MRAPALGEVMCDNIRDTSSRAPVPQLSPSSSQQLSEECRCSHFTDRETEAERGPDHRARMDSADD